MEQLVARRAHNPKVAGSSPVPATKRSSGVAVNMPACHAGDRRFDSRLDRHFRKGLVAQSVEQRTENPCVGGSIPSQATIKWRISSAGRASALQAEGRRFEPVILHHKKVLLAQLVEHLTFNQRVRGSSPLQDTILNAGVAELADALDLGSSTFGVQVQLLSPAPFTLINLGKIFKSFIFFYF